MKEREQVSRVRFERELVLIHNSEASVLGNIKNNKCKENFQNKKTPSK